MRALLGSLLMLAACGGDGDAAGSDGGESAVDAAAAALGWREIPPLPQPVANNALAAATSGGRCLLVSAGGIDTSRAAAGIVASAFLWREGDDSWSELPALPADPPRIASSAVSLRGAVYVFGGYSVAGNGDESSHADMFALDLESGEWSSAAPLPVPIDDAVAVAWRDRFILVVSGWSNTASVADVQVYDADTGEWSLAGDFPGISVFGGAGAVWQDELVVVDGVRSAGGFSLVNQVWVAALDPEQPTALAWRDLGAHPPPARYRAAAGAVDGLFILTAGTADPYNYDGLSYDSGQPSAPLADSIVRAAGASAWSEGPAQPIATMDHRALAGCGDLLYGAGGMVAGPAVTARAFALGPEAQQPPGPP